MALTRQQKADKIEQVSDLLAKSKLTVFAAYQGITVKEMQQLRVQARAAGTDVKVVKNRLFKRALQANGMLEGLDTPQIKGQLLYAFNEYDEAAPAQMLAAFAKTSPQLSFAGAITADGQLLDAAAVSELAALPSKDQLRAQLLSTISAPASGLVAVMAANIRSVLYVLNARAESSNS